MTTQDGFASGVEEGKGEVLEDTEGEGRLQVCDSGGSGVVCQGGTKIGRKGTGEIHCVNFGSRVEPGEVV